MKPFAIYFPQFHPIPTNDRAWGQGFTDWHLVAHANLREDWRRRAPARGFYDGASATVQAAQSAEARAAGLGGFAVYHYWFYSHQELDRFERNLLAAPVPGGFPWFLVWASEGWSRRWVGDPTPLISLDADPPRDAVERHCDHLATCFSHPAYYRIDGKPYFAWYHLGHFRRPAALLEQYRRALQDRGFDALFAQFIKNPFDAEHAGLTDIHYLFEPRLFFGFGRSGRSITAKRTMDWVARTLGEGVVARLLVRADALRKGPRRFASEQFLAYLASAERRAFVDRLGGVNQEVVSPGWNNAPRYGNRHTAVDDVPAEAFARLLGQALSGASVPPLVNAWNEWSEGAAIEPCAYLGGRYLDAVTQAVGPVPSETPADLAAVSA